MRWIGVLERWFECLLALARLLLIISIFIITGILLAAVLLLEYVKIHRHWTFVVWVILWLVRLLVFIITLAKLHKRAPPLVIGTIGLLRHTLCITK